MKEIQIFRTKKKLTSFYIVTFLISISFLLIGVPWSHTCYGQSKQRPNIIVIIPDDMGWSDIGYNGSGIKTPNLDKLEQTGIRLNHEYVMATCTPTRVGIFTGQYASRFGVLSPDYGEVIPLGTPTMASLLKSKGYFTALVGKWHMGSPPYIPVKYGFESAYGYFDGQLDPYMHKYKKETKLTSRLSWNGEGAYLKRKDISGREITPPRGFKDFKYLDQKGHYTDLLTDQAVYIIKNKRQTPFFIYLAYGVPHYPLDEPQKWMDKYKNVFANSSRRRFAASVTHMDAGIGRIIKALKETGQRDNTLILFTSDNGGQKKWDKKEREIQYKGRYTNVSHNVLGNNFPLRGWKGSLYEGGIRVPAFINWPGHLASYTLDVPVKWTDWLPTFLGLTGSSQVDIQKLNFDGQNLWSLLREKEGQTAFEDRSMYWETPSAYAVRKGPWKLIMQKKTGQVELYNIKDDFREFYDLSGQKSDKVQQLKNLIAELKKGKNKRN